MGESERGVGDDKTRDVLLRAVSQADLPVFFQQQLDPAANHMAAFTSKNPADREAFYAHWTRIMADKAITIKTILYTDQVAGHIATFERFGDLEVTYWLGRAYWGKGVATEALKQMLNHVTSRPLYARAAKDNIASIRVLEKCGFAFLRFETAFANARGCEIEEALLVLAQSE